MQFVTVQLKSFWVTYGVLLYTFTLQKNAVKSLIDIWNCGYGNTLG